MPETTLNIRRIDDRAVDLLKAAAGARQWTLAEYVWRLAQLHVAARARADAGDEGLQAELTALGLQTVTG